MRVTFFKDSANAEIELNVLIGIVGNSLRNYVSYAVFALCIYKFVAVLFTADIFAAPAPASWLSSVT